MPPPAPFGALAELPLRVQLITLNVEWSLYMPPPYRPEAEPLTMLKPEISALAPSLTWKTRLAWLASTAKLFGPGPLMLTILFTTSSPLASVIVCPLSEESKLIASSLWASASACRNEPGPLSRLLVTVMVAASALGKPSRVPAIASAENNLRRYCLRFGRCFIRLLVWFSGCSFGLRYPVPEIRDEVPENFS